MDESEYRVRLISVASFYEAITSSDMEQVIFKVTPTLSESRKVEYNAVSPVHLPGSIQVYKNTASREFSISATLISRTPLEALENMDNLQLLRGWCTPYFGTSTTLSESQRIFRTKVKDNQQSTDPTTARIDRGVELLGAPPDVLYLYAYSANEQRQTTQNTPGFQPQRAVNIHRVPVVMTSLDFSYPDGVDYLPSSDVLPSPFPTKMEVSISLVETHSPNEYQRFNLADFKTGRLVNF